MCDSVGALNTPGGGSPPSCKRLLRELGGHLGAIRENSLGRTDREATGSPVRDSYRLICRCEALKDETRFARWGAGSLLSRN